MATVVFLSFGYSNGQPHDTMHNFNLRNLPNPKKEIKSKHTGTHKSLQEDLFAMPTVQQKFQQLCEESTQYLTDLEAEPNAAEPVKIGFGCFSGKHRSVAIVERLTQWANEQEVFRNKYTFVAEHRDINVTKQQKSDKKSKRQRKDQTRYVQ